MRRGWSVSVVVAGACLVMLCLTGAASAKVYPFSGCHSAGRYYHCNWGYANPVLDRQGVQVGSINDGGNTIACQSQGAKLAWPGGDNLTSTAWSWALASNGRWGWTSEIGIGLAESDSNFNFEGFANIRSCGNADGPAPGAAGYPGDQHVAAGEACLPRQWRTVNFPLRTRLYVITHGRRKLLSTSVTVYGEVQVGGVLCHQLVSTSPFSLDPIVGFHIQSTGLSNDPSRGPMPAGHVVRGWGINYDRLQSTGQLTIQGLACRKGSLDVWPGFKPLLGLQWYFPTRVDLPVYDAQNGLRGLPYEGVNCTTVADYPLSFSADGDRLHADASAAYGFRITTTRATGPHTSRETQRGPEEPTVDVGRD